MDLGSLVSGWLTPTNVGLLKDAAAEKQKRVYLGVAVAAVLLGLFLWFKRRS